MDIDSAVYMVQNLYMVYCGQCTLKNENIDSFCIFKLERTDVKRLRYDYSGCLIFYTWFFEIKHF